MNHFATWCHSGTDCWPIDEEATPRDCNTGGAAMGKGTRACKEDAGETLHTVSCPTGHVHFSSHGMTPGLLLLAHLFPSVVESDIVHSTDNKCCKKKKVAHGGGKRCQHPNCDKAARGATDFCQAHGGGKRCQHPETVTRRKWCVM